MKRDHFYAATVTWTGNLGSGTSDYKAYTRNHIISGKDKPEVNGSSDPVFRGDATRYNPEELLVASLSACHMLTYLHLCAVNHVVVTDYVDQAKGTMIEHEDGSGEMTEVTLYPHVTVKEASMKEKAFALHEQAHHLCFIARSVNFKVQHQPVILSL